MMLEYYESFLKISFIILGVLFFISSLDELLMIVMYLIFRIYHFFTFRKEHKTLTISDLDYEFQKPVAVMIACWHEKEVIFEMLTNAVKSIKYKNYHLFVGTYPNDIDTQEEILKASAIHPHIHCFIMDHEGPTTKADNINFIWRAIYHYEKKIGKTFEIFVIHDAEDHVPEYGLSIFNHLIPRKDVIQLPVLPLKVPWYEFTAGTYLDEFASMHLMGIRVREWLSGHIPTAGVGCGFSRAFLEFASKRNNGLGPLGYDTLTEDYELPLINDFRPNNEAFYDSIVVEESGNRGKWVNYVPAVRSYFPKTIKRAIIQKSRWILGISLQGTEHIGWKGSPLFKYMLFRDRKGIVTNLLTFLGLILMLFIGIDWLIRGKDQVPDFFENYPYFRLIVSVNVCMMFILLASRFICTTIVYGPAHGMLSILRIYLGNIINGLATIRAIRVYWSSKRSKTLPKWDKTSHQI